MVGLFDEGLEVGYIVGLVVGKCGFILPFVGGSVGVEVLKLGKFVGKPVGDIEVGFNDGFAEGLFVGYVVEGIFVGLMVLGKSDGCIVGMLVGATVVGIEVGMNVLGGVVGSKEGVDDGLLKVGLIDGFGVGSLE
jgi:hypothetical protein